MEKPEELISTSDGRNCLFLRLECKDARPGGCRIMSRIMEDPLIDEVHRIQVEPGVDEVAIIGKFNTADQVIVLIRQALENAGITPVVLKPEIIDKQIPHPVFGPTIKLAETVPPEKVRQKDRVVEVDNENELMVIGKHLVSALRDGGFKERTFEKSARAFYIVETGLRQEPIFISYRPDAVAKNMMRLEIIIRKDARGAAFALQALHESLALSLTAEQMTKSGVNEDPAGPVAKYVFVGKKV